MVVSGSLKTATQSYQFQPVSLLRSRGLVGMALDLQPVDHWMDLFQWSASSQFGFLTSFFSIYNIYLFISVSSNTTVVLHTLVIKWSDLSSPWTSRSFTGHSVIIWKCLSNSSQKLFAFYYYFCYFPYKQITMNVVLQIQSVTTMPSVRIITVLMFVLVKLGLQEMEKHVMVRWAQLC